VAILSLQDPPRRKSTLRSVPSAIHSTPASRKQARLVDVSNSSTRSMACNIYRQRLKKVEVAICLNLFKINWERIL
jgi:hypothetical protein